MVICMVCSGGVFSSLMVWLWEKSVCGFDFADMTGNEGNPVSALGVRNRVSRRL